VIETLRPLPTTPCSGVPAFVLGAAVVRGAAVPVVKLDVFLGAAPSAATRFVLVRCGDRAAALAVDAVSGVASLAGVAPAATPLLGAGEGAFEALGALDGELVALLRTARIVPDDAWRAIAAREDDE
jgi:chemotaxis signal transduction protein